MSRKWNRVETPLRTVADWWRDCIWRNIVHRPPCRLPTTNSISQHNNMRLLFFSAAMSLASAAAPSKWAPLIALTSSSFGVKSALGYADHWHTDLQLSATPASLSHVEEKNNSTVSLTEEHSTEVCTPSAECELCPHGWRVSVERDDEKIKGEFEACENMKGGRNTTALCFTTLDRLRRQRRTDQSIDHASTLNLMSSPE
eukprot:g6601.t1 g6601   contig23:848742-849575(+)